MITSQICVKHQALAKNPVLLQQKVEHRAHSTLSISSRNLGNSSFVGRKPFLVDSLDRIFGCVRYKSIAAMSDMST